MTGNPRTLNYTNGTSKLNLMEARLYVISKNASVAKSNPSRRVSLDLDGSYIGVRTLASVAASTFVSMALLLATSSPHRECESSSNFDGTDKQVVTNARHASRVQKRGLARNFVGREISA